MPFVRSIAWWSGVVVIGLQQRKDSEILAAPSLTSDNLHVTVTTMPGVPLTGLTVMLAHDGVAIMHVAAGDMHTAELP